MHVSLWQVVTSDIKSKELNMDNYLNEQPKIITIGDATDLIENMPDSGRYNNFEFTASKRKELIRVVNESGMIDVYKNYELHMSFDNNTSNNSCLYEFVLDNKHDINNEIKHITEECKKSRIEKT